MIIGKMHPDEIDISKGLVQRLLAAQFPEWAGLSIQKVRSAGTDNALYRLGDDLVVRLPRIDWAVDQVDKEQRWLPELAAHLPLAIPVPIGKGSPGQGYPWAWSVYRWLPGENATIDRLNDPRESAIDLAEFILALQQVDTSGAPEPGPHNSWRGVPLSKRADSTRSAIASLGGVIDRAAATTAWETALAAPDWNGPPVWLHGDIQSGNLLTVDGRLSAVIDFGCLGVGDPACDLQPAWNLFSGDARAAFRKALLVDNATWARGRGWALSWGLIALPYYMETNPVLAGIARFAIDEVLNEDGHNISEPGKHPDR